MVLGGQDQPAQVRRLMRAVPDNAGRALIEIYSGTEFTARIGAEELEAHFASRVRTVVRVPYDPHIASGSAITFRDLQPETREAARQLAATLVEGLRQQAAA